MIVAKLDKERNMILQNNNWAAAWDFQQFDFLTSVESEEPVQPPF